MHALTTARTTGLAYLGLAVTGMLGFLVVRPRLHDPDDATQTLANLVTHEGLARTGLALELGVVLTQALVALAFLRLFRRVDATRAGALAAFGLVNAAAILGSAAALGGALEVAGTPDLVVDPAGTVQVLYALSDGFWAAGNLFFGLWLVPMGRLVLATTMPRLLGRTLVVGGVGYVLAAFLAALAPDAPESVATLLTLPASVGELWMVGYLLVRGGRDVTAPRTPVAPDARAAVPA